METEAQKGTKGEEKAYDFVRQFKFLKGHGEWERLGDSWGQAMPFYLGRAHWGQGVRTSVLRRADTLAGSNLTGG